MKKLTECLDAVLEVEVEEVCVCIDLIPSRRNEDLEEYDKFERESEREYNPYDEYSRSGRSTRYIRY